MKAGVTTSVVAHAALLIVAIVGLGSARPLQPEVVDSISVDLVPVTDFTNIRKGSLDSKLVKTDTPAIVDDVKPAQLAQPTGNTDQNQVTPQATDKVTPAPVVNTAPKPVPPPQPDVKPDPVPDPTPKPAPAAAATPAPTPVDAQPQQEVAAAVADTPADMVAPVPAARPPALVKTPTPKVPAKDVKVAEVAPKPDPTPAKPPASSDKVPDQQAKIADQVAALINSEKSRGATTGSGGPATLGKTTGHSATLSESEMGALSAAMKACFSPPPGALEEGATAQIEVKLDRSGMVVGRPQVLSVTGASTGAMTGSAAVRAVQHCGQNGYTMLPAEKYDGDGGWNTVDVTFNANDT